LLFRRPKEKKTIEEKGEKVMKTKKILLYTQTQVVCAAIGSLYRHVCRNKALYR
jgi:hypothetical protein